MQHDVSILVIGAGPAGLSLGYELARRRLDYVILEKAQDVGDSWARMPRNMRMNSPWSVNRLPGTELRLREANRLKSRREFHSYLVHYAAAKSLRVRTNTSVRQVGCLGGGGFVVLTDDDQLSARLVVNATGYFCNPHVPAYPGMDSTPIRQISVTEYVDPQNVARLVGEHHGNILIVGKRITAGQLALELHDAGFAVTISGRTPIEFGMDLNWKQYLFPVYYPVEKVLLRIDKFKHHSSFHPMHGGRIRRLIDSGVIQLVPAIVRFDGARVGFEDGRSLKFDGVIWATGYRPALAHLRTLVPTCPKTGLPTLNWMESSEVPHLYFLGLDQQVDFTSRMLRGIRRDAVHLAKHLDQVLSTLTSPKNEHVSCHSF